MKKIKEICFVMVLDLLMFSCYVNDDLNSVNLKDKNNDGQYDEIAYYIGSGVHRYYKDSNFDGKFDKCFTINREGKIYRNEFGSEQEADVSRILRKQ